MGTNGSVEAGAGMACARSAGLSVLRQAQLVAGALALAGFILGTLVSPWWHLLSGVVGLGLIHAGLSGTCGMALLLGRMPWNRRAATARAGDRARDGVPRPVADEPAPGGLRPG